MKKGILFLFAVCILPFVSWAQTGLLYRDLKLGDRGSDVLFLQQTLNKDPDTRIATFGPGSLGQETDYLGSLTRAAVMKFQHKYRTEVLYPAGLFAPTGYVGSMTRKKITSLLAVSTYTPPAPPTAVSQPKKINPVVSSVFPSKVRTGETVTILGENFTATGNRVLLGDGPVLAYFENLSSADGKTITFVYRPPTVKTMSDREIRSLPSDLVQQIEGPIKAAGGTLADVNNPYSGIQSEAELREYVQRNNLNEDHVLYHSFWVVVENANGKGSSNRVLVSGLRKFPFDSVAENSPAQIFAKMKEGTRDFVRDFIPTAHAQFGGGYTTGIIMICTCNSALMTFQLDITGAGTGLYVFYPGFIPMAGSGLLPGPWLGMYITGAGFCLNFIPFCFVTIPANMPGIPIGYAL